MSKVAITACSDGQDLRYKPLNEELISVLKSYGHEVVESKYIYAQKDVFQGTPQERASELMRMFRNPEITEIYDISGGDIANQILPYLDFEEIAKSKATFWGYSDLTTIINAIYTCTGKESVLYQVKNMVWGNPSSNLMQRNRFQDREELFSPELSYIQGQSMEGILVGGNIRCFLKLAGTKYFPDLQDKILLLESLSGGPARMSTFLSQLQQLGAFEKVNGIILGNFTQMEKESLKPDIIELIKEYAQPDTPIAKTYEIGHGRDSKALIIGRPFRDR